MNEYKIIESEFHWKDNMGKFETVLNEHARQGWDVTGFSAVGDSGSSFIALLQRAKNR